jgi:2-keto-4-pentenoate hydratase/2-oxohepta-3-ene-1,7-dioic acid hydratase in catechol pathway
MKFCRFYPASSGGARDAAPLYGLMEGHQVKEITEAPWKEWSRSEGIWPVKEVQLAAPVEPSKIVCIGRNYAAHAAELGNEMPKEPMMFLKAPSSMIGPEEAIVLTKYSTRIEYEGELAVVVGKKCANLSDAENPFAYVLGYTCLNDVTARDLQKSDVQFTRAKSFDTFCPIGPHIETEIDARNVLVETFVNGERRQSGNTSLMAYPVEFLLRWISRMMTLMPGDVIATGTPAGVGALAGGDTIEVSVEGVGVLRNPVEAARA